MDTASFILDPVMVSEVQINHQYAVILNPSEDDPEIINDATFHPMTHVPSEEEMTREYNRLGDAGVVIMFFVILYRDATTFQMRSMRNNNVISFIMDETHRVVAIDTPDIAGH